MKASKEEGQMARGEFSVFEVGTSRGKKRDYCSRNWKSRLTG